MNGKEKLLATAALICTGTFLLSIAINFVLLISAHASKGTDAPSSVSDENCIPILPLSPDKLFATKRRVFAHYFDIFPLSLDNKRAEEDYYTKSWLVADPKNMWYLHGGFLRSRPLPTAPVEFQSEYRTVNFEKEIRLAMSRGISGFTYDIGDLKEVGPQGGLMSMLKAASIVDPRFKIALMVDHLNPVEIRTVVARTAASPPLFRVDDKTVVVPFMAETLTPSSWSELKTSLAGAGMNIFLIPTFLSISPEQIETYRGAADAFGLFGTPQTPQGEVEARNIRAVHSMGFKYMSGISPQGYRPKDYKYWETNASQGYRDAWMAAINEGAEWIQLTTWNDFSESTQVSPYTDQSGADGNGFFNLTGFYSAWFATGKPPAITHDVLYYFYRRQNVEAEASNAGQRTVAALPHLPPFDSIELLAFLTEPAKIEITIAGKTYSKSVERGIQNLVVPLSSGTPRFSLRRGAKEIIALQGKVAISISKTRNGFADLTYWSGSASKAGECKLNVN